MMTITKPGFAPPNSETPKVFGSYRDVRLAQLKAMEGPGHNENVMASLGKPVTKGASNDLEHLLATASEETIAILLREEPETARRALVMVQERHALATLAALPADQLDATLANMTGPERKALLSILGRYAS